MELTTLSAPPDQPRGDVAGLLGLDRARYRAGQDDAVADAFDLDSRQRLPQRGAHAVEVALDRDVVGGDLLAVGVEEHDVGLADRGADDVGALRRADHGVGDLGIGDQHVLDVARQVDRSTDLPMPSDRNRVLTIRADRGGRHRIGLSASAATTGDSGADERQRGDRRERQGANR